jgi:hypothetical protein
MMYDAESVHNMSDISNTDAVGYDKLEERAANPDQNRVLAHSAMFDQLLAEYFVQKRQQVVNINELIDKLGSRFTQDTEEHHLTYQPSDPNYTKDPYQRKTD